MPMVIVNGANPLATNWWALALRGLAAVFFALVTILVPGVTLAFLIGLFGAFALLDGILNIVAGFRAHGDESRWWSWWLVGIAGIVAGVLTFAYPFITVLALVYLVAGWAIWSGVFHIIAAVRLRKYIQGEWLVGLTGIVQVAFGMLLVLAPATGALTLVLWLGVFALITGVLLLIAAFRLRSLQHRTASGVLRHA